MASVFATFNGILELASLEARRAGIAMLWIAALGFAAALCLIGAWFALLAGLAMWAVSAGLPAWATLLAAGGLNGLAGFLLIQTGRGKTQDLRFFATRRQVAALASSSVESPS